METIRQGCWVVFNALPRRVKIILLIGGLVLYNLVFLAYLLFISGIIPYLVFFHAKG